MKNHRNDRFLFWRRCECLPVAGSVSGERGNRHSGVMTKAAGVAGICGMVICALVLFYFLRFPEYAAGNGGVPAIVAFERDTIQLGMVKAGIRKEAVFRFTNTGRMPFIIRDVRTSCGCTKVDWDKRPVKAGESGEIGITFESASGGWFSKEVDVYCNVENRVVNLKLYGRVIE